MSSLYIFHYRNEIYQLEKLNAQNIIFLLWLILLLLPLFSEMEFLGVKIKKEVETANKELKDKVETIETQIAEFKISNSFANNIQIGNGILPTEEKIKELLQSVLESQSRQSNYDGKLSVEEKIEDKSVYLFKVRLNIEKKLNEIQEKIEYDKNVFQRKGSLMFVARNLARMEVLDKMTYNLICEVVQIANRGVHGEIVSDEYIDFVQKVEPEIQYNLNKILQLQEGVEEEE